MCRRADNLDDARHGRQVTGHGTDRRRVFINGLVYTLGRAVSYTGIALVIYFGASQMDISGWFQRWGEKLLGPALIIIGLFMLDFITIN
ncbi:MAG: sulfite exporter TauE/SafE family protein, partial [Chloroflexi bacterium]|nr:sulfite exporter TauE/SafE family protein [Chloroflexota bacterium]